MSVRPLLLSPADSGTARIPTDCFTGGFGSDIAKLGRIVVARYYFNLADSHEIIRDEDGIELADPAHARAEAVKAVEELLQENPTLAMDGTGWRLEVVDASGTVLFTISLDRPS